MMRRRQCSWCRDEIGPDEPRVEHVDHVSRAIVLHAHYCAPTYLERYYGVQVPPGRAPAPHSRDRRCQRSDA